MTRHTAFYARMKAEHRCIACADPLPTGWGILRCQACNQRLRAEAARRYRRTHPAKTAEQRAQMREALHRKRLERRYGRVVDAFVQAGAITRSSLLALVAASEQRGAMRGWHAGYRAGARTSGGAQESAVA